MSLLFLSFFAAILQPLLDLFSGLFGTLVP